MAQPLKVAQMGLGLSKAANFKQDDRCDTPKIIIEFCDFMSNMICKAYLYSDKHIFFLLERVLYMKKTPIVATEWRC